MHVVDILKHESWVTLSANSLAKAFCKSNAGLELSVRELLSWSSTQSGSRCNIVNNIQIQWISFTASMLYSPPTFSCYSAWYVPSTAINCWRHF